MPDSFFSMATNSDHPDHTSGCSTSDGHENVVAKYAYSGDDMDIEEIGNRLVTRNQIASIEIQSNLDSMDQVAEVSLAIQHFYLPNADCYFSSMRHIRLTVSLTKYAPPSHSLS